MHTSAHLFIKQTLTASIDHVRKILAEGSFRSRKERARAVCREFGLLDLRGKERVAGCARALAVEGRVTLPPRGASGRAPGAQERSAPGPHIAIWSGYGRLQDLCLGFELNSD